MSDHDPRFPANVDQRHITWTQYVEFHTGSGSPSATSTEGGGASAGPPPISPEEVKRRAAMEAKMAVQDLVEQTRREACYHLRVNRGQGWDECFATMVRLEQQYARNVHSRRATAHERSLVNYMLQENPLRDFNTWASQQGNRWCMKLNQDAAKKQAASPGGDAAAREASATRAAARAARPASGPLDPRMLASLLIGGITALVFLALGAWLLSKLFL